jgi:hypothetical protein
MVISIFDAIDTVKQAQETDTLPRTSSSTRSFEGLKGKVSTKDLATYFVGGNPTTPLPSTNGHSNPMSARQI